MFSNKIFNALPYGAKLLYFFLKYNPQCKGKEVSLEQIKVLSKTKLNKKTIRRYLKILEDQLFINATVDDDNLTRLYKAV